MVSIKLKPLIMTQHLVALVISTTIHDSQSYTVILTICRLEANFVTSKQIIQIQETNLLLDMKEQ